MIGGQVDPPERVDRRHERHLEALGLPPGERPPRKLRGAAATHRSIKKLGQRNDASRP